MLVLTRNAGESITLGDDVVVTILSTKGGTIKVGIEAPRSLPVRRTELVLAVADENKSAALGETDVAGIRALLAVKGPATGS
jgi:carbon storage regulator